METELEKLTELANEVETKLDDNADDKPPEQHQRKMRFAAENDVFNQADVDKALKSGRVPKPEERSLFDLALAEMVCSANPKIGGIADVFRERLDNLCQQRFGAAFRTMTTGGTGTGQEITERAVAGELFNDIVLGAQVARLFEIIDMPTNPFDLPVMGDSVFYKPGGEGQAVTATDLATAKRTLTAYTVKAQVDVSDELEEDSVVMLIPQIRAKLRENASREMDKLVLLADTESGATGNINSDDAAPAGTEDYFLGFDGIVKYALVTNSGQSTDLGALAIEDFGTLLGLLDGKYVAQPKRLAWISDPWTYLKALQLSDFRTVDKFGERATFLLGNLGIVYGMPYIVTDTMTKVDVDGKYTTTNPETNNTKGRLIIVHRDMWKVGVRRPAKIATERSATKGLTSIVVSFRLALVSFNAAGKYTSIGFNVTI